LRRHYESAHKDADEKEEEDGKQIQTNESEESMATDNESKQSTMSEEEDDESDTTSSDNDSTSNDDDDDDDTTAPWKYIIIKIMEDMELDKKEDVDKHYKKFVQQLQKRVHMHVNLVRLLKRDKTYRQLKKEESRWLKRGYSAEEALSVTWRLRKLLIKSIIDKVLSEQQQQQEHKS